MAISRVIKIGTFVDARGFNNGGGLYPSSLTSLGFPNCWSWHDVLPTDFYLTDASGFASHAIPIPNSAIYDGTKIYGQFYVLDPGSPGGLITAAYSA